MAYVNVPAAANRHNGVHSGRRLKVTVLRVAVVLSVVLIVAYVFDGVALFLQTKECSNRLQRTTNLTRMIPETTTTCPPPICPPPPPPSCPPPPICPPPPPSSCPPPRNCAIPPPPSSCPPPRNCAIPPPPPSCPAPRTCTCPIPRPPRPPRTCPPPPSCPPTPTCPPAFRPPPVAPRQIKLHCDNGWELHGTKCYFFSSSKHTWGHSSFGCLMGGGQLVKIENLWEQWFLSTKLRELMWDNEDKFWIGLTDSQTEGVWKWTDGSSLNPSLTFWMRNEYKYEPDNWTGLFNLNPEGEDCVQMGETWPSDHKCWYDQHCDKPSRFICEKAPTEAYDSK